MNAKNLFLFIVLVGSMEAMAKATRYRLVWNDDPSTTITIGWDQTGTDQHPKLWLSTNGVALRSPSVATASMHEVDRREQCKGMNNCFVRLKDLQPATRYYFCVEDAGGRDTIYHFKTAPADPTSRLSFIVGGDSRTFREPRRNGNLIVAKMRPDAVIFAGDMIDTGSDEEWINWMDDWQSTISPDHRMYPLVVARGNHERTNKEVHQLFDTPRRKVYYSLRFAGGLLQLYTLNTEIMRCGPQTWWLKKELKAKQDATWHIAQYHKPVRPHIARKREGKGQYRCWVPQFERHNVKLVIECDSHTHKITWPIVRDKNGQEGFTRNDARGITYIGEGCWGAPIQLNDDNKTWTRDSGAFNCVKWVTVAPKQIEVRTILFDNAQEVGQLYDENRFTPPANIRFRNYGNGDVAIIRQ